VTPTVKWTIAPDFVRVAAFGDATRDDIVAAIMGATRNPRFVRGMGLLVDGRALTAEGRAHLSPAELRERTDGIAGLGFGRCALVAAESREPSLEVEDAVVHVEREAFRAPVPSYGLPTAVFSDSSSAERWLAGRSRA
jgi:hypothetical protein